jgi:hypothetical protein
LLDTSELPLGFPLPESVRGTQIDVHEPVHMTFPPASCWGE